jgi:hypothetical protein
VDLDAIVSKMISWAVCVRLPSPFNWPKKGGKICRRVHTVGTFLSTYPLVSFARFYGRLQAGWIQSRTSFSLLPEKSMRIFDDPDPKHWRTLIQTVRQWELEKHLEKYHGCAPSTPVLFVDYAQQQDPLLEVREVRIPLIYRGLVL